MVGVHVGVGEATAMVYERGEEIHQLVISLRQFCNL